MREIDGNTEICVSDSVTYSAVYLGGLDRLSKATDKLNWHKAYCKELFMDLETLTLNEIADQLEEIDQMITVFVNAPLKGGIYQFGNYCDGKWYKIGETCGYA